MLTEPIVIERTYNAQVAKIWKALTDNEEMKQWYFNFKEFKLEIGFEFRFMGGKDENNQFLHICAITEITLERKLSYSWRYDGYEGISYVTFDLFPDGAKTLVRLTHAGLDSFPKNNPNFIKENFVQGWTYILGTSLKEYLEKK
jgi:uncharacterized protein YndB with AHSA1/START domain